MQLLLPPHKMAAIAFHISASPIATASQPYYLMFSTKK